MFLTMEYDNKHRILQELAQNRSISPQTQSLFLTMEYDNKHRVLWWLAHNRSISSQTQKMFFTQEYEWKSYVLEALLSRPSFLQGFTLQDMREFAKIKEARLPVYRKRLKQIREKIKL